MVIPVLPRPRQNILILTSPERYEHLKCSFCRELLTDPVQTYPTGHRHCELCFWISIRYRVRCPACIEESIRPEYDCVRMGAIFNDKGAKYDIDKLEVLCRTCGYNSTKKEMDSHEHIAPQTDV